jgi:hypothetical protein
MKVLKPREWVHRGVVLAQAFVLDPALLGAAQARRRLLRAWVPGASVEPVGDALLLRLAQPAWVDTTLAPGTPLVRDGALWGAPLLPREKSELAPPPGAVVRAVAGALRVETPGERLDPSRWIDTALFALVDVKPLGSPPPPILQVMPTVTVGREAFKGVPPPAAEMLAAMEAIKQGKPIDPPPAAPVAPPPAPTGGGLLALLKKWFGARTPPAAPAPKPGGSPSAPGPAAPSRPAAPSWWSKLRDALFPGPGTATAPGVPLDRMVKVQVPAPGKPGPAPAPDTDSYPGLLSRLRRWLGMADAEPAPPQNDQKKSDYMERMMDMFRQGQLDDALRHAIPLSSAQAAPGTPQGLGNVGPRAGLHINPIAAGTGRGGTLDQTVFERLKQMYREAVAKLEKEGRIEEAAFVLAELLQQSEEAVLLLDKHKRYRLAAELAETRELKPELVVRQWMRAGEIGRAFEYARKMGVLPTVVLSLEKTDPERGRTLRRLWAELLAASGDHAAAVLVIWSIVEARPRAKAWLDLALAAGGVMGASLLARKLTLVPEAFPEVKAKVLALLADGSLEQAPQRRAWAEALVAQERSPESQVLARATLRALLRDAATGVTAVDGRLVQQLSEFARDPVLTEDLPKLPAAPPPALGPNQTHAVVCVGSDVGTLPLHDVARLPDGRLLLALGEAGCHLTQPDGRVLARFEAPTHHIVLSDQGTRALLVAPRGPLVTVAVLDIGALRSRHWGDLPLTLFARSFDGAVWFVANGEEAMALDTTISKPKALWRVNRVGGRIVAMGRSATMLQFVVQGAPPEVWGYDLPKMTLRARARPAVLSDHVQPGPHAAVRRVAVDAVGQPSLLWKADSSPWEALRLDHALPAWKDNPKVIVAKAVAPLALEADPRFVVAASLEDGNVLVRVCTVSPQTEPLRLTLERSRQVSLRLGSDELLTVSDDRGRVLVYHLGRRALLRNLRL